MMTKNRKREGEERVNVLGYCPSGLQAKEVIGA